MSVLRRCGFVALGLLAGVHEAAAGSISGRVLSGLNPGQSVNVSVEDADTRAFLGSANTDPNSLPDPHAYTIPGLPEGRYKVRVNPGGTDRAFQYWNGKLRFNLADVVELTAAQPDQAGIDFVLTEGTAIAGTVTLDQAGDPTSIWMEARDPATGEWLGSAAPDASGLYVIGNLPPGSYLVYAQTQGNGWIPEYWADGMQNVILRGQASAVTVGVGAPAANIDLALEKGRTLSGHVFLDNIVVNNVQDPGEPDVPGANVNAYLAGVCCFGSGAQTDASGNYTIVGLAQATYQVDVGHGDGPGGVPYVSERWNDKTFFGSGDGVVVGAADVAGIDFGLVPGLEISGRMFRDNLIVNNAQDPGEPAVANTQVRIFRSDGKCCDGATTDSEGLYRIALAAGSYLVQASPNSSTLVPEFWNDAFFREDAEPVTPGTAGVDFGLIDGATYGTLRGTVVQSGTSTGVPGVNVRVQSYATGSDVAGTTSALDGSFVLSNLPPGDYKVLFDTQGSNTGNDQDLVREYWTRCQSESCPPGIIDPDDFKVVYPAVPEPADGPGFDLGTFGLEQGGAVSGRVCIGGEGAACPVSGGPALPLPLRVDAQGFVSSGPFQPFLPGAAVNPDGTYVLRGLPAPDAYKIRVNTSGSDYVPVYYVTADDSTFDNNLASSVQVNAGATAADIDLHIYAGGSISGHVTCSVDGSDVADFPMFVELRNQPGVRFFASARTGSDGRYTVRGLPGGEYEVRADGRGGDSALPCGNLANEKYPTLVPVVEGADTPDVDFVLDPGGSIAGSVTQVVDGSPQPVVNMRVSATDYDTGAFVSDANTDGSGSYKIGGLAIGKDYRVVAETRDSDRDPQFFNFVREYYDDAIFFNEADRVCVGAAPCPGADRTGIDFELALGGAVSGTILEDGTSLPLSGASACANEFVTNQRLNCDQADQNGFYIIRGLPAFSYRVSANAEPLNYVGEYFDDTTDFNQATPVPVAASTPANPVPVTGGVNFGLAAGRRISGRIFYDVDGDGEQDPGESGLGLCVNVEKSSGGFGQGGCANAEGDFTVVGLEPGSYIVALYAQGSPYASEYHRRVPPVTGPAVGTFDRALADLVDVSLADASGADISLVLGGSIRGTLREEGTGALLANLDVNASPFTGQGFGLGARTDGTGQYLIDGLPPGDYAVEARDNVAGAYVREYHLGKLFRTEADAVTVAARSSASDPLATVVDFDLARGGAITGKVYDDLDGDGFQDPGEPGIAGANITVSELASPNRCCLGSGNTRSDSDGNFRVGGLPAGMSLRVQANPPSATDFVAVYYDAGTDEKGTTDGSAAAAVTVAAGGTTPDINFALALGGAISGVVYDDLDGDGERDPGEPGLANVNIDVSTTSSCCFGNNRRTDSDGNFRVGGIAAGSYRVQASPPSNTDYVRVSYDGGNDTGTTNQNNAVLVAVTAGQTTPEIDFGLYLGGSIEGVVYHDVNGDGLRDPDPDIEPGIANVNINVSEFTSNFCCLGSNQRTGADGSFRVRGVPAGQYRVRANASPADYIQVYYDGPANNDTGTTNFNLAAAVTVTVSPTPTPGINFALTLGGAISGSVRDGNGNPIGGYCCVNAQAITPGLSGTGANVDGSGSWTLHGLAPGQYRVDSGTPPGFPREWWNNQPDSLAATPILVSAPEACGATAPTGCTAGGIDFLLGVKPQLVSGPTPSSADRPASGTVTVAGVQVTAGSLANPDAPCSTSAPPCSRIEIGGGGVSVRPDYTLAAGVFTFDLEIQAGAPLGMRSLSIVNDYTAEDAVLVVNNAFEVTAGGTTSAGGSQRLYVSETDMSEVRVYGTADNALLGKIDMCCDPAALALSPEGRLLYVAGGDRSVAVVDTELGREVFRTTAIGPFGPNAIAATSRYVYTVNREFPFNNRVRVLDAQTWTFVKEIAVGSNPFGLRIDPAGRRMWVPNQNSASVSVVDVDPASPTVNTVVATIAFPPVATTPTVVAFSPRGVAFTPDLDGPGPLVAGSRAYVVGPRETYLLDTALVEGADASLAFIDVDGDPATGNAVGSRTGISSIPTRGGGNGIIDIAPLPASATVLAYITEGAQVRVVDVSTNPDRPTIVRTFAAGFFNSNGLRAGADGSRVFFSYNATKDLYALETDGLLTSPALSLGKFDRDRGPEDPFLAAGMTLGPNPVPPAAARPQVGDVNGGAPAFGSAEFDVTISGSGFEVDVASNLPVVWLQGTLVRGTVLAGSTASSLLVRFPATTPTGDHRVVVTNAAALGNASSAEDLALQVRSPASYAPTQNVYVTSFGKNEIKVFEAGGGTDRIETHTTAAGIALLPDGRSGVVNQFYASPFVSTSDFFPPRDAELGIFSLDASDAQSFRKVVAQLPFVYGGFDSPAVTPSLDAPGGVFAYVPNRFLSDTLSVVDAGACLADPESCGELDVDQNPATQTYPASFDPSFVGELGGKLPAGLSRMAVDAPPASVLDNNQQPADVAVSPDGSKLFVATLGLPVGTSVPLRPSAPGSVTILNAATGQVLGKHTFDGSRVAGDATSDLRQVSAVAVSPDGSRVYAIGLDSALQPDGLANPFIYVYDAGVTADTEDLIGCFSLPTEPLPGETAALREIPRGLTLSADGNTLYTVARLRGELWAIDVTSLSPACPPVTSRIPLARGVGQHALARDDGLLYVTNNFTSEVYVLDVGADPLAPALVTTLASRCAGDVAVQPRFDAPEIASIFPASVGVEGGSVTITGANFPPGAIVSFAPPPLDCQGAASDATGVSVVNPFTIQATAPPGTDGPADLRVSNPVDGQCDVLSGRFRYSADTTPPVFTTPAYAPPGALSPASAEIRWTTDEPSDSRVDYGISAALGSSVFDAAFVTDHVVTLSGLSPETTYFFRATSRDTAVPANSADSPAAPATASFLTPSLPDTTPPVITSGPGVGSLTESSAVIQWTTNEPSTSTVLYDAVIDGMLTPGQTQEASGASGLGHSVTLAMLAPDTPYEYVVVSRDSSPNANEVQSALATFTTAALPDTTPPAITGGPSVSYLTSDLVIITWQTNEASTSFVRYGANPPGCNIDEQGVIDVSLTTFHVIFLTNLAPGTAYGFQVGSSDSSGNTVLSLPNPCPGAGRPAQPGTFRLARDLDIGIATLRAGSYLSQALVDTVSFTTPEAPDTTPPTATTPVTVTPLSFDRVLVSVGLDEAASILARYGVSGLTLSAFDPGFSQAPSLVLAGLEADTAYQMSLVLTDPKGNSSTLATAGFTTPAAPDTQAPAIAGLSVASITDSSAVVSWTTDEPADSAVRSGVQGGPLDGETGLTGLRTSHSVLLTGLRAGTGYALEARSRDGAGNLATAAGPAFTTAFLPPLVGSLTPNRASQGTSLLVAIDGSRFDPDALADFGAGVSVDTLMTNGGGTQILAGITVAADAPLGARQVTVTNPQSGLSAAAGLTIADSSVPVVTISEPAAGAQLPSRTVVVRGSVSEPAAITVNGVDAGTTAAFEATLVLPALGANRIVVTATDSSGNRGTNLVDVTALPTISIDDVALPEGNAGSMTATFTVTLSEPSTQTVTAAFATADGTAEAGSDYVAVSGTLTFEPGTTAQSIAVTLNGDTVHEPDETLVLDLSAPTNALILDGQGQATIVNDEPTLDPVPDGAITAGETVTLSGDGFTAGTVIKLFVNTGSSIDDVSGSGGFAPTAFTSTSLTWDVPASVPLGQGFGSLFVVNTDEDFSTSNTQYALLFGSAGDNIPTITAVDGTALSTILDAGVPVAHADVVVAPGATVTITGTGFNNPGVNLFAAANQAADPAPTAVPCAVANYGPFFPGGSPTSLEIDLTTSPVGPVPAGPANFQVVNDPYIGNVQSNSVSAVMAAQPTITSVSVTGDEVTVIGTGFSCLSVINLFNLQGTTVVNLGGLTDGGQRVVPLQFMSATELRFMRPAGAVAGPAFVEVLNPPYIPFSSSGNDPEGGFTFP